MASHASFVDTDDDGEVEGRGRWLRSAKDSLVGIRTSVMEKSPVPYTIQSKRQWRYSFYLCTFRASEDQCRVCSVYIFMRTMSWRDVL